MSRDAFEESARRAESLRSDRRRRIALLLAGAVVLADAAPVWAGTFAQGPKLVGAGAVGTAEQGASVALSADGNTAILGGYADDANTGAAWVFTRSGSLWTQQGTKLVGADAVGSPYQGIAAALSSDGNKAILGGYGDNAFAGAAWAFARSGGV
jgi:hypothetical protein